MLTSLRTAGKIEWNDWVEQLEDNDKLIATQIATPIAARDQTSIDSDQPIADVENVENLGNLENHESDQNMGEVTYADILRRNVNKAKPLSPRGVHRLPDRRLIASGDRWMDEEMRSHEQDETWEPTDENDDDNDDSNNDDDNDDDDDNDNKGNNDNDDNDDDSDDDTNDDTDDDTNDDDDDTNDDDDDDDTNK